MPSDLQAKMKTPGRLLVAHPFNPVYLLPVVEIVGGKKTSKAAIAKAMKFYETIGMKPVHVRKEIEAFVADRLLEAMWRESLWLIKDGICNTQELDDIVRFGFGLRFAQMGQFETYRVAGGEAGMRHFMAQFGPALKLPWTKLVAPELTDGLIDEVVDGTAVQLGRHSIADLERYRDDCLLAVQAAVRATKLKHGIALDE
jgi:carnitine 3-dehydrogenase